MQLPNETPAYVSGFCFATGRLWHSPSPRRFRHGGSGASNLIHASAGRPSPSGAEPIFGACCYNAEKYLEQPYRSCPSPRSSRARVRSLQDRFLMQDATAIIARQQGSSNGGPSAMPRYSSITPGRGCSDGRATSGARICIGCEQKRTDSTVSRR
jgi:hypothetical protein